jgi:Fe-S-cluster containining protein
LKKTPKDTAITNFSQNTRKIPIRLELPEGRIEAEIELPKATMRLVDLAAIVLELSSTVAEMGTRITADLGRQVSCSMGCGACCRQVVPLSPPEAIMLTELLASIPNDIRIRIQNRFAKAVRKLEATGILPKLAPLQDPSSLSKKELRALSRAYFQQQITCPFLEDESCSIYASRPSRCREYLVISPATHCRNPFEQGVERLPISIRLSQALARLWAEATQTRLQLVPLTQALEWSAKNKHHSTIGADANQMLDGLLFHIAQIAAEYERGSQKKLKDKT